MSRSDAASGTSGTSGAAAETHMSWVFFTPDRAYKLLKPVTMPFIDHAVTAQRLASIDREYELNRAITPDVYLGTADVVEHGATVDRMLVMRRLPADRKLSALVDHPDFLDHLRDVAKTIAVLHASRPPVLDAPMAQRGALEANWGENFTTLQNHVGTVIDPDEFDMVEGLVNAYLHRRDDLLDDRIASGFIRDAHGDLTAEDIFCLDDGPRIIDCLAFNDRWRILDVLNDVGFLVMDMHRLAGWQAAEQFMRWYQEFSNEHHPSSLAHHYVAYRAHVRAKVACLRAEQGEPAQVDLARTYHRIAFDHAERARVRVVLVGGGPGTGKTTLARSVGAHTGFPVLSSDEVRKDVTATPHGEHRAAGLGEGIYDPATKAIVYNELRREAEAVLRHGSGVVLDATWASAEDRAAARVVADRCGADVVEFECVVDADTALARVARRLANDDATSDVTPDLVGELTDRRDAWPEALTIDTAAPEDHVMATAATELARVLRSR